LTYVPNGVELNDDGKDAPVSGLERGRFVLFLGRLVPEKQVAALIRAYVSVDTDLPLAIAGSSSHSDDYVREVERLAAADARVRLLGAQYGLEKTWLLKNARLFVQPSTIEGMPIALLEAVASGRPIVVSDLPENLEPVTFDGRTHAYVFRRGDTDDLAAKIAAALHDGCPPQRLDDARSRVVAEYAWGAIADQTVQVYQSAIARHSPPQR
jgi:glycosyltransferase involved in cell wall biosynthesis